MVAGHVIECGAHATGGNFSGFRAFAPDPTPLGFPLAEIAADGSSVITKHDGTGGTVTTDTVTAQLVYEVQAQAYLGPDVTARLDTVELTPDGEDRVRVSGVRGEAPPERLKVCVNELGGFRNTVEFVLVGLDIDAKADWVRMQMDAALAAHPPASVTWTLARTDREDAATEEAASCRLRCSVADRSPDVVGRTFTAAAVELGLASYPGFTLTAPPAPATPYGVYRPAFVPRTEVTHTVVHPDGSTEHIPEAATSGGGGVAAAAEGAGLGDGRPSRTRTGGATGPARPWSGLAAERSEAGWAGRPRRAARPHPQRPRPRPQRPRPTLPRKRRRSPRAPRRTPSPAASPSARSSTPAAATRAATRTSGCGSTGARRPRSAPPG